MYYFLLYTDKPKDAPMSVRISEKSNDSFTVQWDAVTDIFQITYTVQWYGGDIDNTTNTSNVSYTVTGLTSNTSYNVTVVAINTCCGAGPVSDAVIATTMSDDVVIVTSSTLPTPSVSTPPNGTCVLTFVLHTKFTIIYYHDVAIYHCLK